tara:strand:- start:475 stop:1122 length:648 start_codon:yes stop_codon:yes gene_type:complete
MASEVQIAKLALSYVGDRFDITSLTEASTEAEQVNLVFVEARDSLLRQHTWNFAKKFSSPAALTGTAPNLWTFMYLYPVDALRILSITNPAGREATPIKFEVGINGDDEYCVLTDQEDAQIKYIKRITDTQEFDANFTVAFAYSIAAKIAMALTGDGGIATNLYNMYQAQLNMARGNDAAEGIEPDPPEAGWILARDGDTTSGITVFNSPTTSPS